MDTIDYYNLNEYDKKAWELVCSGRTKGVFQLDSNLGQSWAKRVQPIDIEEMSDLASVIRPGTLNSVLDDKSLTQHYVDRKFGLELDNPLHPSLHKILGPTYNIIVYQEQAMTIAAELAGFNLEECDSLRRAMGKKNPEVMKQCEVMFIDGCKKMKVVDDETALKIFSWIKESQKYSFNKCLSPDTTVELENGQKKTLADIKIGEFVKTPSGYAKVLNKFDQGLQPIYEITLESGKTIECTLKHKFLSGKDEIRPLFELHDCRLFGNDGIKTIDGIEKTVIIQYCSFNKTVDIEIDSPDHIFYANGIATSNSHGVSYAKVGYWTAYMKANYTPTFLCASMNHLGSLDPKETLRALILEAKSYGIPVYPPSIKSQNTRFSLKDGAIYFGLTAIKDVGETGVVALQTLVAETGKKIEELSWPELLLILYNVSIKTVEPLIGVGYFDFLSVARIKMLEEYKVFCKLNDSVLRQYKVILENNPDYKTLIDVLNRCVANYEDSVTFGHKKPFNVNIHTKLKDIITLLQQSNIDKDSVDWICRKERELLGIELTYSKLDKCEAVASNTNCAKIREFGGENLAFAAEICSVREYTIKEGKNSGQVMAFVTVSDQTGYLDSVVFSGLYSIRKNMFYEGNTIFIHGKIGDRGSLIIEGLKEI